MQIRQRVRLDDNALNEYATRMPEICCVARFMLELPSWYEQRTTLGDGSLARRARDSLSQHPKRTSQENNGLARIPWYRPRDATAGLALSRERPRRCIQALTRRVTRNSGFRRVARLRSGGHAGVAKRM